MMRSLRALNSSVLLTFCLLQQAPMAVAAEPETAAEAFTKKLWALQEEYRLKLAGELPKVDRVELYLLSNKKPSPALPEQKPPIVGDATPRDPFGNSNEPLAETSLWFPVPMFDRNFVITKTVRLDAEQLKSFTAVYRKILLEPGNALAACYTPHHGVRMYHGEMLVLEADICIQCLSYCLHSPGGAGYERVPLPDNSIQPLLLKLLPLPAEK